MESDESIPAPPGPRPPDTPPPLPPPLPDHARPDFHGRLHPLTMVFALWNVLRGFIIPLGLIYFLGRESVLGGLIVIFVVLPVLFSFIRYATFRYRVQEGELITRQGIFSRQERNIPLSRIQDVRIDQGMLHRLLGMADVHVDTASGQEAEASLSVLAKAEADRLRSAVMEHKANQINPSDGRAHAFTPNQEPEKVWTCGILDLIKAGMTSNHLASTVAILAVVWGLLDDILPPETYQNTIETWAGQVQDWLHRRGESAWLVFTVGGLALLLGGMLVSVTGTVFLFFGFTLARSGEDLHRAYGLLTRRTSSLPRRRIQVLQIEEKLIRRCFGLATLRADRAGGGPQAQARESKAGRDVLVPVMPRQDVESILPVCFPDWEPHAGTWRQVSRKVIWRGTRWGSLACMLAAGALYYLERDWFAFWPIALIPGVYWLNVMSYKHLGYWVSERYFRTRRGWLSRSSHVVPIRNVQSVVIRQTPIDRWLRVGTLTVDTAGQTFTGGGPKIDNVPRQDIQTIAWTLARRAAATRYRG